MTFKSILVQAELGADGAARLAAAASLAAKAQGRVIGVGAVEYEVVTAPYYGFTTAAGYQEMKLRIERELQEAEAALRAAAKTAGVDAVWRRSDQSPASAAARHARAADLVVVGTQDKGDPTQTVLASDLVMSAGIPVLVVPRGVSKIEAQTVFIAWKNTRETRRAIADALPLLQTARRVVLAAIIEDQATERLQAELDDLAERLRLHQVDVEIDLATPLGGLAVQQQLAQMLKSQGADLLVAGAYGHTRMREWAFGGVTEWLLCNATTPVLFSR